MERDRKAFEKKHPFHSQTMTNIFLLGIVISIIGGMINNSIVFLYSGIGFIILLVSQK